MNSLRRAERRTASLDLAIFRHWESVEKCCDKSNFDLRSRMRVEVRFFQPDRTAFLDRILESTGRWRFREPARLRARRVRLELLRLIPPPPVTRRVIFKEFEKRLLLHHWRMTSRHIPAMRAASERHALFAFTLDELFMNYAGLLRDFS